MRTRTTARRRGYLHSRRDRRAHPLLGVVRCSSRGRTSSTRHFAALLARLVPRSVRKADIEPTVTVIVAAYNEESVIARRIENLLELDYPADKLADRRHLRRVDRPHRGDRAAVPGACSVDLEPARRQGRRAGPRRAADRRRDRRLLGCERDLVARRAAQARPCLRRPRGRLRLRPAADPRRRRLEQGGRLLALRDGACAPPSRGSARSPAATARSTRCAAPTTSRSIRASATTSRCRT